MPINNSLELENIFKQKLINALYADMATSLHSEEINNQVLNAAISLLETEHLAGLNVEQIMIGTMNMAIVMHVSKYGNISAERIGEKRYTNYIINLKNWFAGYNEALEAKGDFISDKEALELAIPVIRRAANGCLYLTPCVPNTLNLYFEYLQHLDNNFIPPQIPTGDMNAEWKEQQFVPFNTANSLSLLNLSLFAIKKHKLPTTNLPVVLEETLGSLEEEQQKASFCCTII